MTEYIKLSPKDKVIYYDGTNFDKNCEVVTINELSISISLEFIKYSHRRKNISSIRSFIYKMPEEKSRLLDEINISIDIANWHYQTVNTNY